MSEGKRRAAKKITRRRDDNPVKISSNNVVSWYPSGIVGQGNPRLQQRCKSREEAEAFAESRYAEIGRHQTGRPLTHVPLGEVWIRYVTFLRGSNTPQGTTDQYRSNWRCHMPESIAEIGCASLDVSHWTQIFEGMLIEGASQETMRAVSRTLGALVTFADDHSYFGDRDPFGVTAERRGRIVARLANKAPKAADQVEIGTEHCPSPDTIHCFAQAAERVLPGYGFLLVLLAFASGLRFTECLGLRIEHIDLHTGEIRVKQQLNRYQAWPATAPPKGGKHRTVQIWSAYRWVLVRLVEQAAQHTGNHAGWLFPPDRPVKRWADRANRLINQDAVALFNKEALERVVGSSESWSWTFHWLRHAFASYGLASRQQGGLGLSVTYVQHQLGHEKPSTTTDRYQTPIAGEGKRARKMSKKLPWDVSRGLEMTSPPPAGTAA